MNFADPRLIWLALAAPAAAFAAFWLQRRRAAAEAAWASRAIEPRLRSGSRGDLHVHLAVQTPTKLDPEQEDGSDPRPRSDSTWV